MKKIITSFKYSFVSDLCDTLVECILSKSDHPELFRHPWTIVPIPLHASRQKWRGFNQAAALAKPLAANWNWHYDDQLLARQKATTPQMSLSGKRRKENLHDAFVANGTVSDSILLIDDVATTCSTLMECARTLKAAGAKEVWGLTLAQTIPR
jgi:ComF family protein